MKRFTLDVPEKLHREIKATCARNGTKMADAIREILEREFSSRRVIYAVEIDPRELNAREKR